jgi:hypothetical protein
MLVLPLQDLVLLSSHFVLDLLIVSTTALLQRDGRVCPRILGRRASYRYTLGRIAEIRWKCKFFTLPSATTS